MTRSRTLDLADPVRSLLTEAGLTQVQLAERADKAQSTIVGAVKRGGGVGLDVLAGLCEAAGMELELRVKPAGER